jgi:hypothetical protein
LRGADQLAVRAAAAIDVAQNLLANMMTAQYTFQAAVDRFVTECNARSKPILWVAAVRRGHHILDSIRRR